MTQTTTETEKMTEAHVIDAMQRRERTNAGQMVGGRTSLVDLRMDIGGNITPGAIRRAVERLVERGVIEKTSHWRHNLKLVSPPATKGHLDDAGLATRGGLLARVASQIGEAKVEAAMSDPEVRSLVNYLCNAAAGR